MLSRRVRMEAALDALRWSLRRGISVDGAPRDALVSILAISERFADLLFDQTDASIAKAAERVHIRRILGIDSDFAFYRARSERALENVHLRPLETPQQDASIHQLFHEMAISSGRVAQFVKSRLFNKFAICPYSVVISAKSCLSTKTKNCRANRGHILLAIERWPRLHSCNTLHGLAKLVCCLKFRSLPFSRPVLRHCQDVVEDRMSFVAAHRSAG